MQRHSHLILLTLQFPIYFQPTLTPYSSNDRFGVLVKISPGI